MSVSGGGRSRFDITFSPIVPVVETIDLEIDPTKPHCFAGLQFFTSGAGTTRAVPGAGSIDIKLKTINTEPFVEDPISGKITAATPSTVTWAANTLIVSAIPTGITIATHYRLVVTCNET